MELLRRQDALAIGSSKYYTGKPCRAGHLSERWSSDGTCCVCKAERVSAFFKSPAGKEVTSRYDASPKGKEKRRKYDAKRLPKKLASNMERHVRKIRGTPTWLTLEQKELINSLYLEAKRLTEETGTPHHVDHQVPLRGKTVCGLHVPWNLQVIPALDNLRKTNAF